LVFFGMVAMSKAGVQVIPFSLLMVLLLKLMPDGRQARVSQNLAEFAPARPDWYRETLAELFDLVPAGKINLVVAERIPLVEAARAHELLECGGYAGKVVLVAANGKASDGTHKKW
jgi:NADPH:quinone reductase-like Zn-dependent oxidoreductase